jgi:periplasmic copper chaperone A
MQFRRFLFSGLAALIAVGGAALAQQAQPTKIMVTQAWARATPGKSTIGTAYATVTAPSGDRLVSAASPVAGTAEIHQHTMENGIMKMRQVDGVTLPAGQAVVLSPGGYHIMLMDLKQPLVAGQSFPLTLTFEKAGAVETKVMIGGVGASGPAGAAPAAAGTMAPMDMGSMAGHKG